MGSLGRYRGRDPTPVINIHNDTLGGNKYNENSTDGSSASHFGDIRHSDGTAPCGYTQSHDIRGITMQNTPSGSHHGAYHQDEDTKRMSETHLKPRHEAGASRSPSYSCSQSPSPSRSSQHTQIFSSITDKEFIRRNTSSWFEQGKIFEISNYDQNTMIAGSSMIVVGRKRSSIVCLPLFKHLGIKGNERPFFQARVPVYAKGKPAPSYPTAPCESLKIALEHGRELSTGVWINVGEPQTIRLEEVEVALHGSMCEGDFKKLRGAYLDAQESMTGRNQKRPNAFVLHVEMLWTSITGVAVWCGQRVRTGWRA